MTGKVWVYKELGGPEIVKLRGNQVGKMVGIIAMGSRSLTMAYVTPTGVNRLDDSSWGYKISNPPKVQ